MKTCSNCRRSLPTTEFNRRARSRDGLATICRECDIAKSREYYAKNRERHRRIVRANDMRYQAIVREHLVRFLLAHPCVDCGETDLRVLEFDHRPGSGKTRDISYLIRGGTSWRRVAEELEKCDVRCRNCHALITYARGEGNWRTDAQRRVEAEAHAFAIECEIAWGAELGS
jgi:hypothetical protein